MKVLSAIAACLTILISACFTFALPAPRHLAAHAESAVYARAETTTAYLCTQPASEYAIFALPYTYCVEITGEQGDWYKVKYAEDFGIYRAVQGYCLKSSLKILEEKPATVYLYKQISVTYTVDVPSTSLPVLGEITVSAAYYGAYYQGPAAYSYVLCDGSFGYIPGANDDYPLNVIPEKDPPTEDTEKTESDAGKIVAAVIFGVVAVGALALLILGNRKKQFGAHD